VKKLALASKARPSAASAKTKSVAEPLRDSERTRQAILAAGEDEFADKGLAGARVDVIAEQSGANKRMIYYYFGSKEDLYVAVLERAYAAMREAESELHLTDLDPLDAIRRLSEFKFDYYQAHPKIIRLLAFENLQSALFLRHSRRLRDMHNSLAGVLQTIIAAGQKNGQIKAGIDPLQLYITIAALGYFYFANAATLSTAFGRELMNASELNERRAHVVEVVLDYVRAH
jgi:AcrR family transcriptional regulator